MLPFLVALPPPRKTRAELMKAIDFEYYGYLDEDDGVIVPLEQEYEKKRMSEGTSLYVAMGASLYVVVGVSLYVAGTWLLSLENGLK